MKLQDNPCRGLKVERPDFDLSDMFVELMADAIGKDEEYTRKLLNI